MPTLTCECYGGREHNNMLSSSPERFIISMQSLKSAWCQYELKYFQELNKTIYVIDEEKLKKDVYEIEEYPSEEFINAN